MSSWFLALASIRRVNQHTQNSLSLFRSLSLCCSAFHADKKHFFPQWKRIGTTKVLIIFTVSRCWAGKGKMNRKLLIFNSSATCLLNATNMGSPYSSWKYVSVTLHHSSWRLTQISCFFPVPVSARFLIVRAHTLSLVNYSLHSTLQKKSFNVWSHRLFCLFLFILCNWHKISIT